MCYVLSMAESQKEREKMFKVTVFLILLTAGLLAHEALEGNGYKTEALFVACGFMFFGLLYAIKKES
jgi:hypothetical protein